MKLRRVRTVVRAMFPIVFMGALFLYALWPWLPFHDDTRARRTIVFYGFSVLEAPIVERIFPGFRKAWKDSTGEAIDLRSSFAGSGTVTNQIITGVPAQLALLSLEPDADRLAEAGVVEPRSWRKLPHDGIVNRSPFVIVVRAGNPHGIRDFEDLARPGIRVVHPDPLTSGAASWSIVAEYGAGAREHPDDPQAGYRLLLGIWRNVVAQAASARAAMAQFENGFGDALVTYEVEALAGAHAGRPAFEVVYPRRTVLSEHPLVVVDRNVVPADRPAVDALVRYLWSEQGQRAFVRANFRSVVDSLNRDNPRFGAIEDPFLVEAFGGWARAKADIVDGVWKGRVLEELGR
jgi:sulfate transport system substrate-binding protein